MSKQISREDILRMIGLRDSAGLMSKVNSLMIDMYDEGGKLAEYSTQIIQTEKNITLLAQRVTDDEQDIADLTVTAGEISATVSSVKNTVDGHTTSISSLQVTANSIDARVSVVEGDYVKNAQISLMVTKDTNGYISNALINADDIDFVFTDAVTWYWQNKTSANKRMGLDNSGNLWISGEYRGGTITDSVVVGTGTKKMYIEPTSTGARLVGKDNNTEVLSLGFSQSLSDPTVYHPVLKLNNTQFESDRGQIRYDNGRNHSTIDYFVGNGVSYLECYSYKTSDSYPCLIRVGVENNKALIKAYYDSNNAIAWPTSRSSVDIGQVYLDGDVLKVRTS